MPARGVRLVVGPQTWRDYFLVRAIERNPGTSSCPSTTGAIATRRRRRSTSSYAGRSSPNWPTRTPDLPAARRRRGRPVLRFRSRRDGPRDPLGRPRAAGSPERRTRSPTAPRPQLPRALHRRRDRELAALFAGVVRDPAGYVLTWRRPAAATHRSAATAAAFRTRLVCNAGGHAHLGDVYYEHMFDSGGRSRSSWSTSMRRICR